MELNSNQIAEILPHRYPFALVDRITDYEPGQWAKGIKCVSVGEPVFCGHFPQQHIFPGVLMLEAMAQVGAIAILSLPENKGKIALFGGVKNARFKRQVIPGDVLEMEDEDGNILRFELSAEIDYRDERYVLLVCTQGAGDVAEDESVIMRCVTDEHGEPCYQTLDDERLIEAVYAAYLRQSERGE